MSEHESKAQLAGERALEALYSEEGEFDECACPTCIVREVLEAAWPHLRAAAFEDASRELMGVTLGSKDASALVQRLATLIDEWRSA